MAENMFDLTGKVAIVTGTSRGLGQYMGRALARAGADLVDHQPHRSNPWTPFQKEIEALGRKALPLALDVRDYDSIQRMVEAAPALRQDRHPGQQRRLQRPQARGRGHLGRLEPGPRHQPPRHRSSWPRRSPRR